MFGLEPDHEAIRQKIVDSWSEEEKISRRYYKTVKQLVKHIELLIESDKKQTANANRRSNLSKKRKRERERLERNR